MLADATTPNAFGALLPTDQMNLSEFRRRLEFLRDHAQPDHAESAHERGQVVGARNVLSVVLSMLDQVECECGHCTALPPRPAREGKPPRLSVVRPDPDDT